MYKLMIVDDSNIIRKRIERSFNSNQFELVAVACDGYEAVQKFEQYRPDVVTMDLTMPNMDGLECITKLTSISKDVSILVVSALSDKATGLQALKNGARGFICKPFTDQQLVYALNRLIQTKMAMESKK